MRALSRFNVLKASRCAVLELLSCVVSRPKSSAFDRAMLLIAATIAASITLHNAPFHAVIADPESCIARRDIHRLTGTINVSSSGTGGGASALSVHDDNGTLPDYTLHIAAGKGVERKITAALNCKNVTNIGGSARIVGTLTQLEFLQKGNIVAIFIQGPNKPAPPPPPPIPPPPPACSTEGAANQSACDAVPPRGGTGPACAWCVSKDKLHSLCFDHREKPTGWDCDR